MWATYLPVIPWIAALSLRHGGPGVITAANPGMPDGGLVGESKFDILQRLPPEWTVPTALISPGTPAERLGALRACLDLSGFSWPLILKPDVGQRGVGVRRVASVDAAAHYLTRHDYPVVVQPWHPGPGEAGIFYWRHPDEARGRIASITDKVFPAVTGDGVSTLGDLICRHPRYSRQARLFLARHAQDVDRVPASGETFALGAIGNHSQGALFRDGNHLWSPELEARIDEIARRVPGFFIGRFDVRYTNTLRFRLGEDLSIIELNGVTAEPTDIYDPDRSVLSSYRAMFEQWRLVFTIGARNRALGHAAASSRRLLRLAFDHLRDSRVFPTSA